MINRLYWAFSYLGLMTVSAAFIAGFRHDAGAPSGAEGIETARAKKPEAILLDIEMPGMDGIETCRKLKDAFTVAVQLNMSRCEGQPLWPAAVGRRRCA